MSKSEKIFRQGFVANTNAEGRLKGWDEESVCLTNSQNEFLQQPATTKKSLSNLPQNSFGLVDEIRELRDEPISKVSLEPIAEMLRRRRSTSLTFFKDILGL